MSWVVKTRMDGESATRSPAKGAETIVWLATLGDNGPTGKFFVIRLNLIGERVGAFDC